MPTNYEYAILIAADSIEQLRRSDVYRVLDQVSPADRLGLAHYISAKRPDLLHEVSDVMESDLF